MRSWWLNCWHCWWLWWLCVQHTHLWTTLASAQVGCSHGVRARVWEAPAAGSTPDYSAHRQARSITVHAPCAEGEHSWSQCTHWVARFSITALLNMCGERPYTSPLGIPGTIRQALKHVSLFTALMLGIARSQAKNALNTTVCVWVMSVCPREWGNN